MGPPTNNFGNPSEHFRILLLILLWRHPWALTTLYGTYHSDRNHNTHSESETDIKQTVFTFPVRVVGFSAVALVAEHLFLLLGLPHPTMCSLSFNFDHSKHSWKGDIPGNNRKPTVRCTRSIYLLSICLLPFMLYLRYSMYVLSFAPSYILMCTRYLCSWILRSRIQAPFYGLDRCQF